MIENWRAGEAPLSSDELSRCNAALVRLSVTPMGKDGPWAAFATNDLEATALSGAASVTGTPETPPLTGYGNQTAHAVGLYAAVCALAEVRLRDASGAGHHIDLSAHETLVACTEQVLVQWFFPDGGRWETPIAQRQGSLRWSGAYEVYPDQDGNGLMATSSLGLVGTLVPWLAETGAAADLTDRQRYPDLIALVKEMLHVMEVLRDRTARARPMPCSTRRRSGDSRSARSGASARPSAPRKLRRGAISLSAKCPASAQCRSRGACSAAMATDRPRPHPRLPQAQWEPRSRLAGVGGEPTSAAPSPAYACSISRASSPTSART